MEGRTVRKSGWIAPIAMVAVFGLFAGPIRAADDGLKCEANKNKVAGKYYFCRENAEAKSILTGDPVDYSKCTAKFDEKWDLSENKAPDACPDNVTLTADMNTYIAGQAAETAAIISGTMDVPACGDNLINVVGEQCDGADLGGESCASLGFSGGSLACANCAFDTSACTCGGRSTGDATVADVLSGKTFSNGSMTGLTGTMPNNGTVTITPSTSNQTIASGYHNGSGYCAGDADLLASNIKAGVDIFGVAGSVIGATGNATAGNVLAGKTFSNTGGAGIGTMPDNGAQMIAPGTSNQTIAAGYHNGSGYCAGDADLLASNIKTGVDIFGVAGSVIGATGNATASNVLAGKTFSNTGGSGTGTMTDNGAQHLTPGTSNQTIAAGYHNGSGYCAGDADLQAANVVSGVNLFGVAGTALPAAPLKTGQTDCYDGAGATIACAGTGQDGALQKGIVRGYSFGTTVPAERTVADSKTGLEWEVLCDQDPPGATCPTDHDIDTTYTWTAAFTKITNMNAANYAGHNDWRLPNVNELLTIVKYGVTSPAVEASAFNTGCVAPCSAATCTCTTNYYHWTATTYPDFPNYAWAVNFYSGTAYNTYTKPTAFYVRAVRGG